MDTKMGVLLLGDSLTAHGHDRSAGWANQLSVAYAGKADVIVRGYSGYTSRWVAHYIRSILKSVPALKAAVVWLGANDSVLASTGSNQFVPVENTGPILSVL
jgi:lysophospholipase L1-like esterase